MNKYPQNKYELIFLFFETKILFEINLHFYLCRKII